MNTHVIEQAHHICDQLSELVLDGMWLERRHYEVVNGALRDEPLIRQQKWFTCFLKVHKDNLVRTIEEDI